MDSVNLEKTTYIKKNAKLHCPQPFHLTNHAFGNVYPKPSVSQVYWDPTATVWDNFNAILTKRSI